MESDKEWSDNQKLIDLSKLKKPDIRHAIPKGFSYFSVDFGLQPGFAHVIESEDHFPSHFAQVFFLSLAKHSMTIHSKISFAP